MPRKRQTSFHAERANSAVWRFACPRAWLRWPTVGSQRASVVTAKGQSVAGPRFCPTEPAACKLVADDVTVACCVPPAAARSRCILGSRAPAFASSLLCQSLDETPLFSAINETSRIKYAVCRSMSRRGGHRNGGRCRQQSGNRDEGASSVS